MKKDFWKIARFSHLIALPIKIFKCFHFESSVIDLEIFINEIVSFHIEDALSRRYTTNNIRARFMTYLMKGVGSDAFQSVNLNLTFTGSVFDSFYLVEFTSDSFQIHYVWPRINLFTSKRIKGSKLEVLVFFIFF